MSTPSPSIATPDMFAPSMREEWVAWQNPLYAIPLDVVVAPAPDEREIPGDPIALADDLGPAVPAPARDLRRTMLEETRFIRPEAVNATAPVFELLRLYFTRPGYLARIVTFLEVRGELDAPSADPRYLSTDLSDPDPFPLAIPLIIGEAHVSVRWHLRLDHNVHQSPPPFLTAASPRALPTCHRVDMLPAEWEDMRYHWGQRPANKNARIHRPGFVRLFAELLGNTSTAVWRIGGQLSGWEGQR